MEYPNDVNIPRYNSRRRGFPKSLGKISVDYEIHTLLPLLWLF